MLHGEQVILRPLQEADSAGSYAQWLNDPIVCQNNSHGRFGITESELVDYIRSLRGDRSRLVLAVVLRQGNRHIGNISLQSIDWISRSAEFAIVIGEKDCWGQGYSREAARLLLVHGFTRLNLNRIYCGTPAANSGMRALALSLGMKEEGIAREAFFRDGVYQDVLQFGVLRSEFDALSSAG